VLSLANAVKAILILVLLIGIAAALQSRRAAEVTGTAVVHDGDTLTIAGERIRLQGIDAPEFDQICKDANGRDWACGAEAARRLRNLAGKALISCSITGADKYDRSLGDCYSGERNLAAAMAEAGLAVATDSYFAEEAKAKGAKRGLWRGSFELPVDWRKRKAVTL
jgi:endonuclease YncB( thermonuclease family)